MSLLITKRTNGEFALLTVLNGEFAEFSDYSLQKDGRLIDDAGSDLWELILYS